MIRVALRSARRLFRDAVVDCLDARPDFAVVGNVADLYDLPVLCDLRHPDVVVVDVGTGLGAERQVLYQLQDSDAFGKLVVVYEQLTPLELSALLTLGVDTLMPYSVGLDALLVVLRRYGYGYRRRPASAGAEDGLTEQEGQVITLLSAGHTVNQIAQLLEISTSAVANAKRRIYRKLHVESQCQVAARATALGIGGKPHARPAVNGSPLGIAAVLRGAAVPAMDKVIAALDAGGVSTLTGGAAGPVDEAVFAVLVDPALDDWPGGPHADLPVALVRSAEPGRAEVLEALLRGAVTVVTEDRIATDLVPALTLATHGYLAIESGAAGALLDAVRASSPATPGLPVLTSRERDILRSIANGHTVRLTARALGIAEKTVENTQSRLFRKLGARNRPGALAAAHALGLLELIPSNLLPVTSDSRAG
jgi:two-component system, NarL family, nitrate/nitrite response regulator NarL